MRTYVLVNYTVPLAFLCLLGALAVGVMGARRQERGLRQTSVGLTVAGVLLLIVSGLLTLLIP